jgi:glyoxylase-like metal-dependent hydrolase (beta-lactamase superfamily II)
MALRLRSEGASAILLADTAVHPALLHEPDWVYVEDGDSTACAETRRLLLPEIADCDVVVACGHYPGSGIGRVVTRDGRVVWEELS